MKCRAETQYHRGLRFPVPLDKGNEGSGNEIATEPSREWKLPLWFGKTHSEGIVTFDIGVQCVQCSAKRLPPHLAEFFPSTVGRSLEFLAVKKFGKELGTENHNSKWTAQ